MQKMFSQNQRQKLLHKTAPNDNQSVLILNNLNNYFINNNYIQKCKKLFLLTQRQKKHTKNFWLKFNNMLLIFGIIFIIFVSFVKSQQQRQNCARAPTAELRRICRMMRQMDRISRNRAEKEVNQAFVARNTIEVRPPAPPPSLPWQEPIPVPVNARGQFATHPYDCMTLQCLCPFFNGQMANDNRCYLANREPLKMGYRKEYRMLTDNERQRFHYALTVLKQNGEYDRLSSQHLIVGEGSGAHSGPGFLPWHREYLKRVEIAIRLIDPGLSLPYWDSVMDGYLPNPADSIMHTPLFIGEPDLNGFITNGPFAFWRTLGGRPYIHRALGREGHLFTEQELNNVMLQTNIEYILAYTVPVAGCPFPINYQAIEYTHSNIHLWIGGDMKPPVTSSNDPIFFFHHSFVDFIWELWRQNRQPRFVREYAYSPDIPACANPLHFSYAQMRPFNLINRDGLSNSYTDQMYRYAPRPTCTAQNRDCGSPYLFCNFFYGYPHCVSKVKLGGFCAGFEGTDICYNGQCYFGRCFAIQRPSFTMRAALTRHFYNLNETLSSAELALASSRLVPFGNCYNHNPCCEKWAKLGECKLNAPYMKQYCGAACKTCTPSFNTTNDCANRHKTCAVWAKNNQCTKGNGILFMQENCRKSCKLCTNNKCSADSIKSPKLIEKTNNTIQKSSKLEAPPTNKQLNVLKKKNIVNLSPTTESFRKRA